MSVSDEKKSDADDTLKEDVGAASGPTIDHDAADVAKPSSFVRNIKLYGALVGVLMVAVIAAAGTYPYWRTDAAPVLERVGLDLENLEQRLNVPRWAITHGREDVGPVAAASSAVAPTAEPMNEPKPEASPAPAAPATVDLPKPVSAPEPTPSELSEAWRGELASLAEHLESVQERIARVEDRLRVVEDATSAPHSNTAPSTSAPSASAPSASATPSPSTTTVPSDVLEKLDLLATRLADLENHQLALESASTAPAPAPSADQGALIATVVGLAERVAAMEGRGAEGASAVAALREDTRTLASRLSGLDEKLGSVDAALADEKPERDRATLLLLSVGQLAVATSGADAFDAQLEAVRSVSGGMEGLTGPLDRLAPHAGAGAPTLVMLRSAFAGVSDAVVRSRDVGAPEGVLGQTLSRVASLVTIRKVDELAPETVDGALALADAALAEGDLAAAVGALEGLTGAPGQAASAWLTQARARITVDGALSDLQTAAIRARAAAG